MRKRERERCLLLTADSVPGQRRERVHAVPCGVRFSEERVVARALQPLVLDDLVCDVLSSV